jgi:aromatic-L-amino-acid decarboxylase
LPCIDPLESLASIAKKYRLWFHVDGAFGALAALSATLKPRLSGIERADSVALDFHKWAHVPYDAGFLLVREGEMHRGTFASAAAYLQRAPRGLAAGDVWPCDLGPICLVDFGR